MKPDMPKRFVKSDKTNKGRFPRGTKKLKKVDQDGEPVGVMGMKRVHRFANKFFSSHGPDFDFAVMRRFLMRRRGQSWDKVYSEICDQADDRSFTGHQFREWLGVEQNCSFNDKGELVDDKGNTLRHWTGHVFYVHPTTKTLEYFNKRWPKWQDNPPHTVFEMDGVLYHKHEDLWYRVQMKEVPQTISPRFGYSYPNCELSIYGDVFEVYKSLFSPAAKKDYRLSSPSHLLRFKYGLSPDRRYWYCVWKQSANRREIAKLKKLFGIT